MPRSIRVRPNLVPRVKLAVKHNGFLRQKDLAESIGLADSTVRNFLTGKRVDYATFVEICQRLNLEWQDFADLGEVAEPRPASEEVVDSSQSKLSSEQGKKENTLEASHKIEANLFLEYFSKSIDQLKSKDLDVRIGAISTLETIAKYSQPAEHWTIMEYLAAFVRTNAPRKEEDERSPELREDIQAALTVIGRRDTDKDLENQTLNLSNTDLRGAELREANLQMVNFYQANLQRTILTKAQLQGADLGKANLQQANIIEANIQGAILTEAQLQGAFFNRTNLQQSDLMAANLEGAQLSSANLQKALLKLANLQSTRLCHAQLQGADIRRSDFSGASLLDANMEGAYIELADFRNAHHLTQEQIDSAQGQARLPEYLKNQRNGSNPN